MTPTWSPGDPLYVRREDLSAVRPIYEVLANDVFLHDIDAASWPTPNTADDLARKTHPTDVLAEHRAELAVRAW